MSVQRGLTRTKDEISTSAHTPAIDLTSSGGSSGCGGCGYHVRGRSLPDEGKARTSSGAATITPAKAIQGTSISATGTKAMGDGTGYGGDATQVAGTSEIAASPPTTDAEQILARAVRAEDDPRVFGLSSYRGLALSPSGPDRYPSQIWFQAPAHKRVQASDGRSFLFDGDRAWMYTNGRVTLIDTGAWGGPGTGFLRLPFALRDASAQFVRKDQVAGRSTYVLELSPKPSAPSPSAKSGSFRQARVWLDRRFYIPLKINLLDDAGRVGLTWAYTNFEVNPPLDPALFAFVLPASATVVCERPPVESEVPLLWQHLAGQAPYPVFRPGRVPGWLAALNGPNIGLTHGNWLTQDYYEKKPPQNFNGLPSALTVVEMAGPAPSSSDPTPEAGLPTTATVPVQIGVYQGQYGEQYHTKWIVFERDGTQIWIEGQGNITKDELVDVAASLGRVLAPSPVTPVSAPTLPLPVATAQAVATFKATDAAQHFGTGDLVFVDALHGRYMADRCPGGEEGDCDRPLSATTDGGQTWRVVGVAPKEANSLRFANRQEGWAFGPGLYATHDGGATWTNRSGQAGVAGPGGAGEVASLELLGGSVGELVQHCTPDPPQLSVTCAFTLRLSADKGSTWRSSDGLAPIQGQVVSFGSMNTPKGSLGWLLIQSGFRHDTPEKAHFRVTHYAGLTWEDRPDLPCPSFEKYLLDGDRRGGLWLLCAGQAGAGSQGKSLYVSNDEGQHWELRASALHRVGQMPVSGYALSLAVTSPDRAWLALERGTLYGTTDSGRTWGGAIPMPGDGSVGAAVFTDEAHGWWVTVADLFRTTDGGAGWQRLPHP